MIRLLILLLILLLFLLLLFLLQHNAMSRSLNHILTSVD